MKIDPQDTVRILNDQAQEHLDHAEELQKAHKREVFVAKLGLAQAAVTVVGTIAAIAYVIKKTDK